MRHFLTWWAAHLMLWVPARLRALWQPNDGATAELTQSGELRIPDTVRTGPVVLRLPPGAVLQREVDLPLAAERNLLDVLRYEMDRLTPFGADELYWTARTIRRDRTRGRLSALLLMVPRRDVDGTVDALRGRGLRPVALRSADGAGAIPLLPGASQPERRRRTVLAAGALACTALALAAIAIPFARQTLAAMRIERRVAELRPQVDRVEAGRRTIAGAAAGSDAVARQMAESANPLGVLAAVTAALPDDAFLRELTVRARVLTLAGQSAAAARLIPDLAAVPGLRDPAFAGPVTRNEAARADLFTVRATVAAP